VARQAPGASKHRRQAPIQGTNGSFYGTTYGGGDANADGDVKTRFIQFFACALAVQKCKT
jgi:hypothetical protein